MTRLEFDMKMADQAKLKPVDELTLQRARQYTDYMNNPCYKHDREVAEAELAALNIKETLTGEAALMVQGERRAIQRRLDAMDANERDAREVIKAQLNIAV